MLTHWKLWLLGLAAIPLVVWGYDRSYYILWVGGADFEIAFVIVDADTDNPIEGAEIYIHPEAGSPPEDNDLFLTTDRAGIARRFLPQNTCAGRQSALRFTDTFSVRLPSWWFQVSAPGYETREMGWLSVPEYSRQVQRLGSGTTKLVVRVPLAKK